MNFIRRNLSFTTLYPINWTAPENSYKFSLKHQNGSVSISGDIILYKALVGDRVNPNLEKMIKESLGNEPFNKIWKDIAAHRGGQAMVVVFDSYSDEPKFLKPSEAQTVFLSNSLNRTFFDGLLVTISMLTGGDIEHSGQRNYEKLPNSTVQVSGGFGARGNGFGEECDIDKNFFDNFEAKLMKVSKWILNHANGPRPDYVQIMDLGINYFLDSRLGTKPRKRYMDLTIAFEALFKKEETENSSKTIGRYQKFMYKDNPTKNADREFLSSGSDEKGVLYYRNAIVHGDSEDIDSELKARYKNFKLLLGKAIEKLMDKEDVLSPDYFENLDKY